MSIQEQFTNIGIGSSLIKKLLEWAKKDSGIEKISLEVFSNNKRAIHLYTKLGFAEEGRRKKQVKLGPNEYIDDILMSKFI
jgi:RimJ/RimL family protein N-acetyltransferase